MGLADLFGYSQISSGVDPYRNTLAALGAGIASGKTFGQGMAAGLQNVAQYGKPADDVARALKQEKEDRRQQINQTREWVTKNFPELSDLPTNDAFQIASQLYKQQLSAGPAAPIKANPGDVFLDPTTYQPIASVPAAEPKPTSSMQEYQYAVSQGFTGTFADYERELRKASATSIDFNANQGGAAAYADRMATAESVLGDPKMVQAMTDVGQTLKGNTPLVGNFLTSPERQQAEQAQRDFVNAVLRRESGAVISPSEFENAKQQYFPQPGDSSQVIEQKARNRKVALEAIARQAGPNYSPPTLTPGALGGGGNAIDWQTYFGGQ